MTRAGFLDRHVALPAIAIATAELQPVDDHTAEGLIFCGQDEFSKCAAGGGRRVCESHHSNERRHAIAKIVRRWREAPNTNLKIRVARNDIEASVAESAPHVRRAHRNSMAPAFRLQH
jgi:hypothetical protein